MFKTITKKLMLIVFCIMCSSFLVSNLVSYFMMANEFSVNIQKNNKVVAKGLADNIGQFIQNIYNINEDVSLTENLISMPPEKQKRLVVDTTKRFPFIEVMYLLKADGYQVAKSSSAPLSYGGERWWYKKFMAEQKPYITKSYYSIAGNVTVTSVYHGVYDNGKLVGILGADIKLDALQKMVEDFSNGQDYYVYVLDGDGVVVAHPDKNQVAELNNYKTLKKTILVKDAQGNVAKDEKGNQKTEEQDIKVSDGLKAITEKVMQGESGVAEYKDLNGDMTISAYHSVALPGKSDSWSIITVQKKDKAMAILTNTAWKNGLIVLMIAIIALALIYRFASRITGPITRMVEITKQIASGNLSVEKVKITSQDEIGQLGESINAMTANLRELVQKISVTTEQIAASSEELMSSAEQSSMSSQQVANSITEVAQGTEKQLGVVNSTTMVVEEMSKGIQQVADNAIVVAQSAEKTANAATDGGQAIEKAVSQMAVIEQKTTDTAKVIGELEEKSQKISQIVETIANISGQTNLLALNAAIEAARAGEQGRGFAVVADEVRKLAEQSQEAAKQIATIIGEVQQQTNNAVVFMNEGKKEVSTGMEVVGVAGENFWKILTMIREISSQIQEISNAIRQVTRGSQQVVNAVAEIDKDSKNTAEQTQTVSAATEEQSASMEEIAASSQMLANMAEDLQVAIHKFKI